MAQRWMQAKIAKIKRDGVIASRGPNAVWGKTERDAKPTAEPPHGWMVKLKVADAHRNKEPVTYGPFATEPEAKAFLRRSHLEGTIYQRGGKRVQVDTLDAATISAMVADHVAKLKAQRELSRATREALGRRTAWAR